MSEPPPYSQITPLINKMSTGLIYNSFRKTLRILTYKVRMGKKNSKNSRASTHNILLRAAQYEAFPTELQALKDGRKPRKESRILGLAPFLYENRVIISKSRLEQSTSLEYGTKYPVILLGKERIFCSLTFTFHPVGTSLALCHHGGSEAKPDLSRTPNWWDQSLAI